MTVTVMTTEPAANASCTSAGCTTAPISALRYRAILILNAFWSMEAVDCAFTANVNPTTDLKVPPGESGGGDGGGGEGGGDGGESGGEGGGEGGW